MLGAITGDTIGSVYEFRNTKEYGFALFHDKSAYTDDSIMTMAVAYWLLHDKEHTYQGLEDAMVTLGEQCPCPMGGYGGGFRMWLFAPEFLRSFDQQIKKLPIRTDLDETVDSETDGHQAENQKNQTKLFHCSKPPLIDLFPAPPAGARFPCFPWTALISGAGSR